MQNQVKIAVKVNSQMDESHRESPPEVGKSRSVFLVVIKMANFFEVIKMVKRPPKKKFSKNFYCTKSFVLKFQGESLELFQSYHVHFRRYRHLRSFWHTRAKNQRNC